MGRIKNMRFQRYPIVGQHIFGPKTWFTPLKNNNIRKQYAGIGYTYDAVKDQFVAPQPFPSWTLDSNNDWQAPTPKPEGSFIWDEETLAWVETPAI